MELLCDGRQPVVLTVRATKAATDATAKARTPSGWAAKTPRTAVSPAATKGIAAPNIARLQKKLGAALSDLA